MAKRIVKTLKHGLIVLSITPEHIRNWDKHPPQDTIQVPMWDLSKYQVLPPYVVERKDP
jgi:hypothetical protein